MSNQPDRRIKQILPGANTLWPEQSVNLKLDEQNGSLRNTDKLAIGDEACDVFEACNVSHPPSRLLEEESQDPTEDHLSADDDSRLIHGLNQILILLEKADEHKSSSGRRPARRTRTNRARTSLRVNSLEENRVWLLFEFFGNSSLAVLTSAPLVAFAFLTFSMLLFPVAKEPLSLIIVVLFFAFIPFLAYMSMTIMWGWGALQPLFIYLRRYKLAAFIGSPSLWNKRSDECVLRTLHREDAEKIFERWSRSSTLKDPYRPRLAIIRSWLRGDSLFEEIFHTPCATLFDPLPYARYIRQQHGPRQARKALSGVRAHRRIWHAFLAISVPLVMAAALPVAVINTAVLACALHFSDLRMQSSIKLYDLSIARLPAPYKHFFGGSGLSILMQQLAHFECEDYQGAEQIGKEHQALFANTRMDSQCDTTSFLILAFTARCQREQERWSDLAQTLNSLAMLKEFGTFPVDLKAALMGSEGHLTEARQFLQGWLEENATNSAVKPEQKSRAYRELAAILARQGHTAEAQHNFEVAIDLEASEPFKFHATRLSILRAYQAFLHETGNTARGLEIARQADQLRTRYNR